LGKPENIATTPPPDGTLSGLPLDPEVPLVTAEDSPVAFNTADFEVTATGVAIGKSPDVEAPPM
jgi:hypothetical protein